MNPGAAQALLEVQYRSPDTPLQYSTSWDGRDFDEAPPNHRHLERARVRAKRSLLPRHQRPSRRHDPAPFLLKDAVLGNVPPEDLTIASALDTRLHERCTR